MREGDHMVTGMKDGVVPQGVMREGGHMVISDDTVLQSVMREGMVTGTADDTVLQSVMSGGGVVPPSVMTEGDHMVILTAEDVVLQGGDDRMVTEMTHDVVQRIGGTMTADDDRTTMVVIAMRHFLRVVPIALLRLTWIGSGRTGRKTLSM